MGGMLASATATVTAFGTASVMAGMNFDSAMSQVAATSGKTLEQLNQDIATTKVGTEEFTGSLREFAQYLGSTTAFSATQCAEALNYMALAGYDTQKSMDMLPKVLDLASAGNMDLARASDMVTDAQTALGLSMEETGELVNKMAKTAASSNTSVEQMGDAILQVGGLAKTLTGGTTELSTAFGLMADNGIKGAEAGTHMRNILLALTPQTDAAAAAWENLGVSAYDSEGNLRPLEDTFQDLSKAMANMTTEERTNTISNMFNKTDLATVNALLDTTKERWDSLGQAIDESAKGSVATDMAKTQLDNLSGSITYFKSALEGMQIAISDQLTPTLVEFDNFGTDGISRLTKAFQEGGIDGLIDEFGNVLSEGINLIVSKLPDLIECGARLLGAIGKGIMDNAPLIIDTGIKLINMLIQGVTEAFPIFMGYMGEIIMKIGECLIENAPMIKDSIFEFVNMLVTFVSENAESIFKMAIDIVTMLAEGLIKYQSEMIEPTIQLILSIGNAIISNLPLLIDSAIDIVLALADAIIDNLDLIIDSAVDLIIALTDGILEALPRLIEKMPIIIEKIVEALIRATPKILAGALEIMVALADGLIKYIYVVTKNIPKMCKDFIEEFKKTDWSEIGKNIMDGLKDGLLAKFEHLKETVKTVADGIYSVAKKVLGINSPSKKFAYVGEMCVAGMDEQFEDYDPYETLDETFKARPLTIGATLSTGSGMSYNGITDSLASVLEGMAVIMDGQKVGTLTASYVNDSLGRIASRRT